MTIMEGLELKLECETVEQKGNVQWFKDNKEIINQENWLKKEKTPSRIHTLLISTTSLEDSGTFSINIEGTRSIAKVEVEGNIIHATTGHNTTTNLKTRQRQMRSD